MRSCILIVLFSFLPAFLTAQDSWKEEPLNFIYVQTNLHLEKRGTSGYETSNPDLALAYERTFFGIGRNRFQAGVRTGFYKEYVLTGNGWDHPVNTRWFVGVNASYQFVINRYLRLQVHLLSETLFPDDYDEIWGYYAVEPSICLTLNHFYAAISSTKGFFPFFDPVAVLDKAGLRVGIIF